MQMRLLRNKIWKPLLSIQLEQIKMSLCLISIGMIRGKFSILKALLECKLLNLVMKNFNNKDKLVIYMINCQGTLTYIKQYRLKNNLKNINFVKMVNVRQINLMMETLKDQMNYKRI